MHILNGKFGLVEPSPFWTGPSGYAAMPSEAPALLKDLRTAGLVVFKVRRPDDPAAKRVSTPLTGRPELSQVDGRPDLASRYTL
jgi:hypothetical protein